MAEASITVPLSNGLLDWLKQNSARNERSLSGEVRFHLHEAARRAGHRPAASLDNPSGNPPLPVVTAESLPAVKAELAQIDAEVGGLEEQQARLGRCLASLPPDDERRLSYLRSRAAAIRSHVQIRENALRGTNGHA